MKWADSQRGAWGNAPNRAFFTVSISYIQLDDGKINVENKYVKNECHTLPVMVYYPAKIDYISSTPWNNNKCRHLQYPQRACINLVRNDGNFFLRWPVDGATRSVFIGPDLVT